MTFSTKNAFWVCNWVSNMVYPRYSQMFPSLKEVRDSLDNSYLANQNAIEQRALEVLKAEGSEAAVKLLNDYREGSADARQLEHAGRLSHRQI